MSIIDELEIWCLQRAYEASGHKPEPRKLRWELIIFVLSVMVAVSLSGNRLANLADSNAFHGGDFYGDKISHGDEFDFIVVGSGAAGSAVAGRLAMAGLQVLLVEAGGDPNLISKIPKAAMTSIGSELDWAYDTLSNNKSCLSEKGKMCRFSRGKCLGGSTSINKLMYTRGNREDFDFDLPGWSWEDMEPYFLRYEGFKDARKLPESSKRYHNTSGIMPIEYFYESSMPWHSRLFEAFQSLNFPRNLDVNGFSQIGVTRIPGYTTGGERMSAASAYLNKNVKRTLTLAKNILCTGIIIDENNVANGIKLSRGDETLHLYSKHEIILSAGAIGTPQLLMLSGIGPKDHLQGLSIPVKADLPVGEDMTDHVLPLTFVKVDHDAIKASNIISIAQKTYEAIQWLTTGRGELASIGIDDVTAFVNSGCYDFDKKRLNNNRTECEIPTLQYIISYLDKGIISAISPVFNRLVLQIEEVKKQLRDANENSALMVVSPVILRPHSRGWIRLASANPLASPLIMPNYLDDDRDVEEMVRGLKIVENMVDSPEFRKHNASILRVKFDGCEGEGDDYWRCYSRQMTYSVHHAVGTAALGRVLDEKMRVRGVKNLRVADASALPSLPRGNTAATIIALGERVSDMVLEDLGMETYINRYHKTYYQ